MVCDSISSEAFNSAGPPLSKYQIAPAQAQWSHNVCWVIITYRQQQWKLSMSRTAAGDDVLPRMPQSLISQLRKHSFLQGNESKILWMQSAQMASSGWNWWAEHSLHPHIVIMYQVAIRLCRAIGQMIWKFLYTVENIRISSQVHGACRDAPFKAWRWWPNIRRWSCGWPPNRRQASTWELAQG